MTMTFSHELTPAEEDQRERDEKWGIPTTPPAAKSPLTQETSSNKGSDEIIFSTWADLSSAARYAANNGFGPKLEPIDGSRRHEVQFLIGRLPEVLVSQTEGVTRLAIAEALRGTSLEEVTDDVILYLRKIAEDRF